MRWAALGYTALPCLLILKEPDIGSSLAFLSTSLTLMFVAGVSPRFLGKLVGGASLQAASFLDIIRACAACYRS